jgi:hypothetical protein
MYLLFNINTNTGTIIAPIVPPHTVQELVWEQIQTDTRKYWEHLVPVYHNTILDTAFLSALVLSHFLFYASGKYDLDWIVEYGIDSHFFSQYK